MRTKWLISLLGIVTIMGLTVGVQGETIFTDTSDYEGNGAVGFFGKYEFPEEIPEEETPDPGIVTPEPSAEQPDPKPKPDPKPELPPKPNNPLPQTGETSPSLLRNLGILLIEILVGILYIKEKIKRRVSI